MITQYVGFLAVSFDGIPSLTNLALAHDGGEIWSIDSRFIVHIVISSNYGMAIMLHSMREALLCMNLK